ncbi:hypothetical protein HY485_00500 [Candidatus Woesearchaeota archaeon]|nr:hypothetical protein [Candidatus Woesearchaeota archaeon]
MKTKIMIIALLLLVACVPFIPSKQDISIPKLYEGSQGVDVWFVQNAPPNDVFEGQLFGVAFSLENKGASDIENGVYVVGLPHELTAREGVVGRFSLKGKSVFNPFGESKIIKFSAHAGELASQVARVPAGLSVDVCYPYHTEVSAQVCINPEPTIISKPKSVCTPSAQSFSGQGAPVVVTKIDVPQILPLDNPALVQPQITLSIKNVGRGFVVDKYRFADACTPRGGKELYNVVRIGGYLSELPLDCRPQELRLSDKENTVVCTLPSGLEKARGSHLALLNVKLDYGYVDKKSKQIYVKRALS